MPITYIDNQQPAAPGKPSSNITYLEDEPPKSMGGFVSNALTDAAHIGKGVVMGYPKVIADYVKSGAPGPLNPAMIPTAMGTPFGEDLKSIGQGIAERVKSYKHPIDVAYKTPVSTALDIGSIALPALRETAGLDPMAAGGNAFKNFWANVGEATSGIPSREMKTIMNRPQVMLPEAAGGAGSKAAASQLYEDVLGSRINRTPMQDAQRVVDMTLDKNNWVDNSIEKAYLKSKYLVPGEQMTLPEAQDGLSAITQKMNKTVPNDKLTRMNLGNMKDSILQYIDSTFPKEIVDAFSQARSAYAGASAKEAAQHILPMTKGGGPARARIGMEMLKPATAPWMTPAVMGYGTALASPLAKALTTVPGPVNLGSILADALANRSQ